MQLDTSENEDNKALRIYKYTYGFIIMKHLIKNKTFKNCVWWVSHYIKG